MNFIAYTYDVHTISILVQYNFNIMWIVLSYSGGGSKPLICLDKLMLFIENHRFMTIHMRVLCSGNIDLSMIIYDYCKQTIYLRESQFSIKKQSICLCKSTFCGNHRFTYANLGFL